MKILSQIMVSTILVGGVSVHAPRAHAQGGVPLWTNRYSGGYAYGLNKASALVVDKNTGKVFVTGPSTGPSGWNDFGTVAYSGEGVPLWTNLYHGQGTGHDQSTGIAVDGNGNVFVTGPSAGLLSGHDYATVGYSTLGVALWTNRCDGPGNNTNYLPSAIAVDRNGNVVVGGSAAGENLYTTHYIIVAYSNSGAPLWTNRYDGETFGDNQARGLAMDGSGSVFVTGYSTGTNGWFDYATVAYRNSGVPLWTNRYRGHGVSGATAIAVDASGNVFVTGELWTGAVLDFGTVAYSGAGLQLWTNGYSGSGGGYDHARAVTTDGTSKVFVTGETWNGDNGWYDYATVAYSINGVPIWTNRWNGPSNENDSAQAVTLDSSGNVFVTGASESGGFLDYATIAYSSGGVPLWTNRYNEGNAFDGATAIGLDDTGNVFVTGYYNFATIKYSSSVRAYLTIESVGSELVLSWTNSGFRLQTAAAITGVFTNILGATSPYTNSMTGPQQYFRLTAP